MAYWLLSNLIDLSSSFRVCFSNVSTATDHGRTKTIVSGGIKAESSLAVNIDHCEIELAIKNELKPF